MAERVVRFGDTRTPVPPREYTAKTHTPQTRRIEKPFPRNRHVERRSARSGYLRGEDLYHPVKKRNRRRRQHNYQRSQRTGERTSSHTPVIHPRSPKLRRDVTLPDQQNNKQMIQMFMDHPNRIRSVADAEQIKDPLEKNFAKFLITHNPDLILVPQPVRFSTREPGLIKRCTVPDFFIHNPQSDTPEIPIFLEITKSRLIKKDTKVYQRRVIEAAAPGVRYVSMYWQNFENIAARHGEFILPSRPTNKR